MLKAAQNGGRLEQWNLISSHDINLISRWKENTDNFQEIFQEEFHLQTQKKMNNDGLDLPRIYASLGFKI